MASSATLMFLCASEYLRTDGASKVAGVITVGSPHHGTALAALGAGRNAREMRRGSGFLAALARAEAGGAPCPALSVYTVHDNLVSPQDSSRLVWARNAAIAGAFHARHASIFDFADEAAETYIVNLRLVITGDQGVLDISFDGDHCELRRNDGANRRLAIAPGQWEYRCDGPVNALDQRQPLVLGQHFHAVLLGVGQL